MDQKPFFVNQEHFLLHSFYEPPWLDLCKSDDFMSIDLVIFRDMKMPQTNHSSHIVHWYMVEHSGACCEHTDRLKISLSLLFAKKVLPVFFVRNKSHMKPFHILKMQVCRKQPQQVRSSTCALTSFIWLLSHVIYLKLTRVL